MEPFTIGIVKSGSDVLIYVSAQGPDLFALKRVVVWFTGQGWLSGRFFRNEGGYPYHIPGEQIEPDIGILKVKTPAPTTSGAYTIDAYCHYDKIDRTAHADTVSVPAP